MRLRPPASYRRFAADGYDGVLPSRQPPDQVSDDIIEVVLEILEEDGYDGLQLRAVASRARMSLSTIYTLFGSREELIAKAVERWMEDNAYVNATPPRRNESPYEWYLRFIHAIFEPWQRNPAMLRALVRAQMSPEGARLRTESADRFWAIAPDVFKDSDPAFVADLMLIMYHVLDSASAKFVAGDIKIGDVLSLLERTLLRIFAGEPQAPKSRRRR